MIAFYLTVFRKKYDETKDRAYEHSTILPPLEPFGVTFGDLLAEACSEDLQDTRYDRRPITTERELFDRKLKLAKTLSVPRCDQFSKVDCRALMMRHTELNFEERTKNRLERTRNELTILSNTSEPGPANLDLPTMDSYFKDEIESLADLTPLPKTQRDLCSLLSEFPLPNRVPSHEIVMDRHFIGSVPTEDTLKIGKLHIAPQDIDAYLNGGEMPPEESTNLIEISDFPAHFGHVHLCTARLDNIRTRAKPTASLPWQLFGQVRSFWSDNLVGKPNELSNRRIEQAVRPLNFSSTSLMGNKMDFLDVVKEHIHDDLAIPQLYRSKNCLTSAALFVRQLHDIRTKQKRKLAPEDVNTFFIEAVWAQGPTFDRNSERLRNKIANLAKRSKFTQANRVESSFEGLNSPYGGKDAPMEKGWTLRQIHKRKAGNLL